MVANHSLLPDVYGEITPQGTIQNHTNVNGSTIGSTIGSTNASTIPYDQGDSTDGYEGDGSYGGDQHPDGGDGYGSYNGDQLPDGGDGYGSYHGDADYTGYEDYYSYDDNGTISYHHNSSDEYSSIIDTHYLFNIYPFEVNLLGIVRPFLIILTALTNILVVGVFLSRRNRGKATNLLFVSIAITDTLTGIALLPNSFYIYAYNRQFLTMSWCHFSMVARFYISRVFHTVSVWQTVLLGVQRFLCVCHPFISSRICTVWKTVIMIIILYIGALVLHVFQLTNEKIWFRQCIWHVESPCRESCIYTWFCVAFQHLMPVFILIYLTCRTIYSLKTASKRVSVSSKSSADKRNSRDKLISITATCIVIVFLVPELPNGIYKLFLLSSMHSEDKNLNAKTNHIIFAVYEIFLIMSFHLNFWIYCVMMRDFRQRIFTIVTFGLFRKKFGRERVMSASSTSRPGTMKFRLSRTSSDVSTRNRIVSRNVSLLSTASELNGALSTPSPSDLARFNLTGNTPVMFKRTNIPMLTQTSADESIVDVQNQCLAQISMESAYVNGDANEDDVFL